MSPNKLQRRQTGFTLLEAIVALVLLSTTGMALFSWINTTLSGLNHALDSSQKTHYRHNALALMQQVNPALADKGTLNSPDFTLNWQATPITPPTPELDVNGTEQPALLRLYNTKVSILREGQVVDEFSLRLVGYLRTG
ncbi:MAG: prepilin-type N-terminal cleavage/methylation domain-containing protein [Methylococcaceae bacterium]|nr:prepilin-type N-terminal cleavage/methylation domain-containing protein [Methylococcaceae bacterium]